MMELNSANELLIVLNTVFEFCGDDFIISHSNEKFSSFLNYPESSLNNTVFNKILTPQSFEKLKLVLNNFENGKTELVELNFLIKNSSKSIALRLLFIDSSYKNFNIEKGKIRAILVPEHSKEFVFPLIEPTTLNDFKNELNIILDDALDNETLLQGSIELLKNASKKIFTS